MTRETKIGLLVGLAFIIVIGILLSDHMTSTTDPPKAPLSTAGPNVRESVAAPTSAQHAAAVAAAAPPAVIAPGQPVLTQQELLPQAVAPQQQAQRQPVQTSPVQTIQVGPGPAQAQPPITIQQTAQGPVVTQPQPPVATTVAQRGGASHPIQGLANQHGEEIVVVGDPRGASQTGGPVNPPVPMAPLREYKAQTGDSLSRLASRFLGGNTKANRDAIIQANASLRQNPDRIIEGRTYLIPVATVAATAPATPATPVVVAPIQPAAAEAPAPAVQLDAAAGAFTWYTVKENDNLWRIAADQMGTGTAAGQIKDFNVDVLKGNDNLQVGMRLRIPPKPVASAN